MEQDERFKHITSDPKFRRIPKREQKVKIDKRFQSMFKDDKFKVKYSVDKRGRPVNRTSTEDLKRYYELSSSEEEDEEDDDSQSDNQKEAEAVGKFVKASNYDDLQTKNSSDKTIPDKIKRKLKNLNVDYARGEGFLATESSSDDESSIDEAEDSEDDLDHGWGELDKDAEEANEITKRLAVCNMDWDRIRAADLMVLLNSFVPAGGAIESVAIYPSEFGKERMQQEELQGPLELTTQNQKDEENVDEDGEEGSKYHMEKLRRYQLNRLKYYYAVVTTDTPNTANHIYEECDGMEYESSATKMDLRFIPDGMTFDDAPKELCSSLPEKYEPRFFTTTALQQAKVQLTWDETNLERRELTEKIRSGKIDDISEADLQNYLASSSGGESDNEEEVGDVEDAENDTKNPIDKYKALLEEIEKQEEAKRNRDIGLEISWGIDLKEKTEALVKKKQSEALQKTPFEEYLDKKREKKKNKRKEKQKTDNASSDDDIPSDVDMNDPYFAEEFQSAEFKQPKSKKSNKQQKTDSDDDVEQNKAELDLLLMNGGHDDKKHFSLKKIQSSEDTSKFRKKRFKKKNQNASNDGNEGDFKVDVADERFSALFSSHHFNIDPTDPHYKKTKGMEALIEEKLKRRQNDDLIEAGANKKKRVDSNSTITKSKAELNVLVKSIKRKTEALTKKKKS